MLKLGSPAIYIILAIGMFLLASCSNNDDDQPTPASVEVSISGAFEGIRGTTVTVPVMVSASSVVQSITVTVDGGSSEALSVPAGSKSPSASFEFAIPGDAILATQYELVFSATDEDGNRGEAGTTINVAPAIATLPTSYDFTRDGSSTVSYSGQLDRLNMVVEIKNNILKVGDNGNVISEQVLLDAFANTNGNGAGFFSFESDRQIKSKVFQPDLDDQLFENLFAAAAEASIAGSSGTQAANGTAGLITRENSGSTILLDANGREFTQLIEKGLMGALMYNQIYNVYLSDGRTGDDVENTALREGKNYTDMEHHWDEAFGYFDPPLDFTSPWPAERRGEVRFWSNYSNVVDNVKDGQLGTNKIIMDAFIAGRTAIVNNDLTTKNAQRDILYQTLDRVAAATTVHYINLTLGYLNEGKIGEAFHTLSEAWAFTNALRYNPNKVLDLASIEEIMGTDYGVDGNFWNVTPEGLNKAKSTLVTAYPELDPVKDEL